MEDLLAEYRQSLVAGGRAHGTVVQRVGDVVRFERTVTSLEAARGEDLIVYLAVHPGWLPEYRKKVTTSLHLFFRWAFQTGRLPKDIATGLPSVRVLRAPRPPAPDELIMDAIRHATMAERAIILLAATMGLRRTEIATLHPSQRTGPRLTVVGKGGRARILTLDDATLTALRDLESLQGRAAFYFPGRFGAHVHPCTIYRWVKRHIGPDWHLHSLRRRAARAGFLKTHDIRAVQEFLGHESLATTALYVNVNEDQVAAVARGAAFDFAFFSAGRRGPPTAIETLEERRARFLRELRNLTDMASEFGFDLVLK